MVDLNQAQSDRASSEMGIPESPDDVESKAIAEVESMFDPDYYRTRYADVFANPQIDPLRHYCRIGWKEGRDPTNWFSTKQYLASHPDVATAGVNPFVHYCLVRRDEFRRLSRKTRGIDAPIEYTVDEVVVDRRGILRVTGWIVTFAPLQEIAISFSGHKIGMAEYGLRRDDVGAVYANYPESDRSGFAFIQELDVDLTDPLVTVEIRALGGVKRRTAIVPTVAPTIQRRPRREAMIRYHIDSLLLLHNMLVVEGWAFAGIEAITVDLDDEPIGTAVIGLPRPDVGNAYPQVPSARWSGFRISKKLSQQFKGEHTVVLSFQNDVERRVAPLRVIATDRPQDSGVIEFHVDSPALADGHAIDPVYGDLPVIGWAVAPNGITRVEISVDGEPKGNAYYGARRPDIKAAFPSLTSATLSGFAISIPQRWDCGKHLVKVVAHDTNGNSRQQEFSFEARSADDAEAWQLRRKVKRAEIDLRLAICDAVNFRPAFVLLLRLHNVSEQEMRRAHMTLESLRNQAYRAWRLRVICPVGTASGLRLPTDQNMEIVEANSLDDLGTSETTLVGLLRPGDDLGADALLEVAVHAALDQDAAILYADERRYDEATRTVATFFKPDWSPDLLLSTNYLGRVWFVRAKALAEINFNPSNLDAGEYDLLLRLTDVERRVHHVPKLLCIASPRPTDTVQQERQALRRALHRRGIVADVLPGCAAHYHRVKRAVQTDAMVSIIIPTIAAKGLIKSAIVSIRQKSAYRKFEIICIDGIPANDEHKDWLRANADKIVKAPDKFNWSRCNNLGVAQASGDFFVFMNDDMEVTDPNWLHALLEHAQRPEVGVVGPMLVYPEGKVQHAGVVLMATGGKHVFRFADTHEPGPFGLIQTQRNIIAVTGACMMISRAAFLQVGGFDEAHTVINNDLDFCLRCWRKGLRVVYTPHTQLIHYEESSRAELKDDYDVHRFDSTWRRVYALGDPYLNPNLARDNDWYRTESEPTQVLHVGHPVIDADEIKRILVVKLDHVGDFITAIPAINRLRERFPTAEITGLVAKSSVALAQLTPAIDRVMKFQFFHSRSDQGPRKLSEQSLTTLHEMLAPYRFDIAIDLRQQMDTRKVLKHTGAKWLAGYDRRGSSPWLDICLELVVDTERQPKRTHVSDALLQMVETVSTACQPNRTVIPGVTQAEARRKVAALPGLSGVAETLFEAPLICIHPGVGSATRQWPREHFAALADLLIEGDDAHVIIVGSQNEANLAKQVIRHVRNKGSVFSLVGRTRIDDLPLVLQSSDLFVGNNSGPHHLAAGLGVPTIGLHSGVVDATEWGPLGQRAVAIRRDMNCSPCYLEKLSDCHRDHACMRGLLPRDVYRVCRQLLALRVPNYLEREP